MYHINTFKVGVENELREMATIVGLTEEQTQNYIVKYFEDFEEVKGKLETLPFRHNGKLRNTYYHDLFDKLLDKNPKGIVFGTNGTAYKAEPSPAKAFLKLMMDRRKIAKKKMLVAKSEGDVVKANMFDVIQLKFKESANSLFGLINLKAFFLYCSPSANAITSASRNQAYYIINNFECTMGSRFIFEKFADVILFLQRNTSIHVASTMNVSSVEFLETVKRDLSFDYLETVEEFISKIKKGFQFKITIRESEILSALVEEIFKNETDRHKYSLLGKLNDVMVNSQNVNNGLKYEHFPEKSDADVSFSEHDWEDFCKDIKLITVFITLYSLPESERIAKHYKRTTTVLSDKL